MEYASSFVKELNDGGTVYHTDLMEHLGRHDSIVETCLTRAFPDYASEHTDSGGGKTSTVGGWQERRSIRGSAHHGPHLSLPPIFGRTASGGRHSKHSDGNRKSQGIA